PKNFQIQLPKQNWADTLQVLYENRALALTNGRIQDIIEGYGRRIYFFESSSMRNVRQVYTQNKIIDPSFEQHGVPLTPAACYFKLRGDRGAHAELDTRMAMHGQQSLRLQTSTYNEGLDVSLFPVQLTPGNAYAITFWARGGRGQEELSFRIGPYGRERRFELSPYWRSYQWVFTAQANEATRNDKTNIIFSLISKGKAWVDLVQLSPEPRIDLVNNPFAQSAKVEINAAQENDPSISIHYTTDGTAPNITSIPYAGPLTVNRPMTLRAAVVKGNLQWENARSIVVNMWPIQSIEYAYPFYDKYNAGGEKGLIDGVLGSERFSDKKWQGWNKGDLDVRLDLGQAISVGALHLNYLQDHGNWICGPVRIEVYGSKKGKRYKKIKELDIGQSPFTNTAQVEKVRIGVDTDKYQYLRVVAVRSTALPTDHPSFGGNPFLFIDEILVERK
ncbi:MAG: chitobiase/beta-hexosaminidase C-terminal domain-containing protein, partial [Bacteroidota bacterium]